MLSNNSIQLNDCEVSVVIPTLGGESLVQTIGKLNSGSIRPKEILVCIPKNNIIKADISEFLNVIIVETECRGQVRQRIEGFKRAPSKYVLQIDDDIEVDEKCIEYLLEEITAADSNIAVAPSLVDIDTGYSVYKKPEKPRIISAIYYWLMNGKAGFEPGKIDKTGSPVGIDPDYSIKKIYETEWLAGGCVLHNKINLMLDDYFPFEGKAFGEDVMHSFFLKKNGIKLFVVPRAVCSLKITPLSDYTLVEFIKNLNLEIIIRKHYMKLMLRKNIRIDIYYIVSVIRYVIKKTSLILK